MPEPQIQTVKDALSEEQVKAANEAEMKKWEGDFDPASLEVPYSREESKDDKKSEEEDPKTDKGDEDGQEIDDAEVETDDEYTEPAPVLTVEDPGEFTPGDYSFEVTLKDGKTHKVSTPEEADKLAEDPENFETPKQLLDFIRRSQKMENQLDKDKEKWEAQKKTFDEQTEVAEQRQETVENMVSEFKYLVGKGLMPKIDKQYLDADWSDPEVAKQPGVKEQMELLNYMVRENEVRAKAKVRLLTSVVDAYNAWQQDPERKKADEERQKAEDDKRAAGEARRVAGARVAGVSASNQTPYAPKGVAVGRVINFGTDPSVWDD